MKTIITLYSLSVRVETEDSELEEILVNFLKKFYVQILESAGDDPDTLIFYGGITNNYSCYTLSNIQFKHFNWYIDKMGYELKNYKVVNERDYDIEYVNYELLPHWKLREDQEPVVDFVLDGQSNIKLLPLVTGTGKTFISCYCLAQKKERFAVMVTSFIDKWINDFKDIYGAKDEEIVVIQGYKSIMSIINMGKEGNIPYKYFILSNATMRNFVTEYEENPEIFFDKYGILPYDFFRTLKIGTLLVDETHLSFNAIFRVAINTGVKNLFLLSATMLPNNDFERRVYNALYTKDDVYHDNMLIRYLDVFAVSYRIDSEILRKLQWRVRGGPMNGAYNHNALEKSLSKTKKILYKYFSIILDQLKVHYLDRYLPGDKCIVFVSTIKMATELAKYLTKEFPNKVVKRYVESDSYDEMLTGDIIVSTNQSAGTGINIPNLRVGIQTVSMGSLKQNIQSSGRLRRLRDRDVRYVYIYSTQLGKQRDYHNTRMNLYKKHAKNIYKVRSNVNLE